MKRKTIIAWLGFLVVLTPFFAVPIQWKEYALIVFGVLIMVVSLSGSKRSTENRSTANTTYVENRVPTEVDTKRV